MAVPTPENLMASFGLTRQTLSESVAFLKADAPSVLQDKLLYSKPSVDTSKLTDDINEDKSAHEKNEDFLEMRLLLFVFPSLQPGQGVSTPRTFFPSLSAPHLSPQKVVWQPSALNTTMFLNL